MKKKNVVTILISVLVIAVFGTVIIHKIVYPVEDIKVFDMHLTVGDVSAFNITKGAKAIEFGIIMPGGGGIRWLDIQHESDRALKVTFESFGELGEVVGVEENQFWLQPDEMRKIKLTAQAKEEWGKGDYYGKLRVIFTRR